MIVRALRAYHAEYGCFPPPFLADKGGRPLHSWRVLLLPFLDEDELYSEYDFTEPWDGPNNSKLSTRMPAFYRCPAVEAGALDSSKTSYLALVGPNAAFREGTFRTLAKFRDTHSTIMVIESPDSDVNWLEPRDILVSEGAFGVPRTRHVDAEGSKGIYAAFADTSVRLLPQEISQNALRTLIAIDETHESNEP